MKAEAPDKVRRPRPKGTHRPPKNPSEWTRARSAAAKLQHAHFDELTVDEGRLAGSLLTQALHGFDIRETLLADPTPGVRPDPDHRDIALHCALLLDGKSELTKAVRGKVAAAWNYADTSIPAIFHKHKAEFLKQVRTGALTWKTGTLAYLESQAKAKTQPI